ncbi:hypothetical protein EKA85_14745 [Pseudomonas veronii]|jgi:hypothetical protein|uniref:Type III secretion effector protein n=3 Tax=Pseudomonas TaxID=286 RepID=A0A7Y1F823_PSEVE|nr:hypothetical protein [Pseudomonas veronii]PMU90400.1 hypothetical protein C1Y30_12485 [Pseudomonas sp. GW704-F3]PMU95327.1 hypothetical protein C1Y28_12330 [Pseudomonas sp. GW704-F5]PMV05710.1 hypothetical protein C1Y29_08875 [Pseudomonas sp. MPBD4-3]PMV28001.1 hypothetical protein C1Y27_21185 [Pseudomonas sp. GW704-F2]PUB29250.1 hypothetical protein C8K66_109170 [Pseudomonas sp. GV105]SBW81793.1 hypothetical protein PVE_R1G3911 [Pseudomonas veronii 1YdBTEX2]SEB28953.1 hypothetical protei
MSASVFMQSVAHSSDDKSFRDPMSIAERSMSSSASQSLFWDSYHFGSAFGSTSSRPYFGHGHYHSGPPQRPLPDNVRPNPGPPPRPTPERPDPHYSKQSNQQLAQALLSNYGAFREGHFSRQVTLESLKKMAERPLTGNPQMDANIRLAKELLRRPELVRALDRNMSTGASDGRLSRDDIMSVIGSDNPFKLKDDKQLIKEMLGHFQQLKGNGRGDSIKLDKLKEFAAQALTGNPFTDHLIQLAKEVMARSILQGRMDNVDEWQRDGKISRRELLKLLR